MSEIFANRSVRQLNFDLISCKEARKTTFLVCLL